MKIIVIKKKIGVLRDFLQKNLNILLISMKYMLIFKYSQKVIFVKKVSFFCAL